MNLYLLAPGGCSINLDFKSVISEHKLQIKLMSISCKIALRWMPQNTFDGKSTLVTQWLKAVRQHAINVDPDSSLGHNVLKHTGTNNILVCVFMHWWQQQNSNTNHDLYWFIVIYRFTTISLCTNFTWGQFHSKISKYLSLIGIWKLLIWYYSHFPQGPMIQWHTAEIHVRLIRKNTSCYTRLFTCALGVTKMSFVIKLSGSYHSTASVIIHGNTCLFTKQR